MTGNIIVCNYCSNVLDLSIVYIIQKEKGSIKLSTIIQKALVPAKIFHNPLDGQWSGQHSQHVYHH